MLIIAITILNIFAAVALPLWSYTIRRDREEETIFRGLQYAEAIRVFRQRNGRYPVTLDELVKIEPRSIRQLWTEPLSEDGEFGLLIEAPRQQPGQPGQPGATPAAPGTPGASPSPQGQPVPNQPGGGGFGGFGIGNSSGGVNLIKLPRAAKDDEGKTVANLTTQGPVAIHGVYLDKTGESLRKFFDKDKYEEWTFTAELITPPVTAPGRPLPRVSDYWLGRSFPEGLNPVLGSGTGPGAGLGIGAGQPGQPGQPGQQPGQPAAPGIPKGAGPGGVPSDGKPPVAEPDTPEEFPEDVPEEEEAPDEDVDEEPPPDEPPPPDDLPEPVDDPGDGRF